MAPFNEPEFYTRRPRYGATNAELRKVIREFFNASDDYWRNLVNRVGGSFRHGHRPFVGLLTELVSRRDHSNGEQICIQNPAKEAQEIFSLLRTLNEAGYGPDEICKLSAI